MNLLFSVVILIITASSIILVVHAFLKKQIQKEVIYLQSELRKRNQEYFLPMRLEAYQRAILLLERIHPNSLVMRVHNPGLSAKALQIEFIKSVREEYNHNVAQQLFISSEGWNMIKNSKEDIIKLINTAGDQMNSNSTGLELSSKIFEMLSKLNQLSSEISVEYLKKEFQELI
jgi:hypothetical protein